MSAAKRKGTAWETAIVTTLTNWGWIHAERRTLSGAHDRGDIAGIPGIVIEAKNHKAITLSSFIDEAEREAKNDGGSLGVAWIKRAGKSKPEAGYVAMTGATFLRLLDEAGYRPTTNPAPESPGRT